MPQGSLVNLLRDRPRPEAALVRQYFRRLNALAEIRYERLLSAQELQELTALRKELCNRLAAWLQKR
jgi:hypothetical protein